MAQKMVRTQGGGAAGAGVQTTRNRIRVPTGGWKRASEAVPRRLIASIDGLEKQGKNHFSLTAPGPIGILSTDIGLDGVVQKFQDKKEIWVADYRVGIGAAVSIKAPTLDDLKEVSDICQKVWSGMMKDFIEIMDGGARTVIADTGTELWEILRMARFGKLTQVMPHHYGPVNAEFREFIRLAYDRTRANGYPHDMNLLMLHKLKDEWKNGPDGKGTRTGEYKRAGFSEAGFLVQCNAVVWRDQDDTPPNCWHCTIQDNRLNAELAGEDLQGDLCNFPTLAALTLECDPEEFA